ncbi:16S rRNA (uracil(1498)-N(3))-methyltransferase [Winogradskyella aurantia]|uniref:Ribosomal RNA small subunit methyltransferase E n=1 Tax=Winogradskyella aurantia TaxID=1915063 RepID=A0A265UTG5_9FLAO|nr:16S rRNA (uracil(1498)-N(3))-methyltransferase [Winogradskyella aurantia]OZV68603.1 16S rRNA (uracil(1498)-N(3))-methyltransferase [Winogradskyella aurantia]
MQLFYSPNISDNETQFSFDKDESRHISKVLRKKIGDIIYLTNGKGFLFKGELTSASLKQCTVSIISQEYQAPRDFKLHLAVAPTKMNDRFEWFLEKATEIGIEEITPILCDHSERKEIKHARFEKIIQSAMKQSLNYHLPKLNATMAFNDFITAEYSGQKFIAHCEDSDKKSLKSQLKPQENVLILIGPEGDFSVKEIESALRHNFIPVTLGENRLRTETAAIAACHSVAFLNE